MRKAAVIATLSVLIGGTAASAAPHHETGPCSGKWFSHITPGIGHRHVYHRVQGLTHCVVNTKGFPGGYSMMRCIMARESGNWPWADSGSSKGLMQLNARYYGGWAHRWLRRPWFHTAHHRWPPSPFVARANLLTASGLGHAEGLQPWGGGC